MNYCHAVVFFFPAQSQPEMEYSLPELQAPRSNVADKPWPQVHSHTQRPHGERKTLPAYTHTHTSIRLWAENVCCQTDLCPTILLQHVVFQVWEDMERRDHPRLEAKGNTLSSTQTTPQLSTTSSAACPGELWWGFKSWSKQQVSKSDLFILVWKWTCRNLKREILVR